MYLRIAEPQIRTLYVTHESRQLAARGSREKPLWRAASPSTAMRGYSLSRLRADRTLFGAPLESFVFSELLKLSTWTQERVMVFHYRDRDKLEVDCVLENSAAEIVGIEVKSAASVMRRDFRGLERVSSAAGTAFKQGIVLYDGVQTLSFAENLRAVPLSALWA